MKSPTLIFLGLGALALAACGRSASAASDSGADLCGDADSDADGDGDSDSDADTDSEGDSDTGTHTLDWLDYYGFTDDFDCRLSINWWQVPDGWGGNPVIKACDRLRIDAPYIENEGPGAPIYYSVDCPYSETKMKWRWLDVEQPPEELGDLPLEKCTTIEICPDDCEQLVAEHRGLNLFFGWELQVYSE